MRPAGGGARLRAAAAALGLAAALGAAPAAASAQGSGQGAAGGPVQTWSQGWGQGPDQGWSPTARVSPKDTGREPGAAAGGPLRTPPGQAAAPVAAPAAPPPGEGRPGDGDEARRLAFSGAEHALWHEAGHMLIAELGLPVIGQEEDAADAFATLMMLGADEPEESRAERLLDVAELWLVSHHAAEEQGEEPDYFGEHDLDAQRGLRIVCFLAGQDPVRADALVEDWGLPADRAAGCERDLATAIGGWDALLAPHYRAEDGAHAPIAVRYGPSGDHWGRTLADRGLLEFVADEIAASVALRPGLVIEAQRCGEANAFWDGDARAMILCYEMLAALEDLAVRAIATRE